MGRVLLGLIMAFLAVGAALAAVAVWVDPRTSIATVMLVGGVILLGKGTSPTAATLEHIGIVSVMLLGAYGLFLCGASLGWCIAYVCTALGLITAAYLLATYALSPDDD